MSTSRIDIFKQMLVSDPINSSILFGLAKEYEKAGQQAEMIETLERYLAIADDEGNAYGMLARAYEKADQRDKARETYQPGTAIHQWPKNTGKRYQSSEVGQAFLPV